MAQPGEERETSGVKLHHKRVAAPGAEANALPALFEPHKSSSDLRHIQPLSYQGATWKTKQRLINIFMLSQGEKADEGESESHECEVKIVTGQSCLINPNCNYHESFKSRNSSAFILLNKLRFT